MDKSLPNPIGAEDVEEHEGDCPLTSSHDKFEEADHFFRQMLAEYHNPKGFRYSLNAFLASMNTVRQRLRIDMERAGKAPWLKAHKDDLFSKDDVLGNFETSRNIVLHQRDISKSSYLEYGLFRNGKLKLATTMDFPFDVPSREILERLKDAYIGTLLDEEHSEIGMQFGVRRTYNVPELSAGEDAVTASLRALTHLAQVLRAAHLEFHLIFDAPSDEDVDEYDVLGSHSLLQETDLNPSLPGKWGWLD